MTQCGICHQPRRVGTGQRAKFLTETGDIRTVIACSKCCARGVLIVAPSPPQFTTVESDDSDVVAVLRGLAKQFESYRAAYARDKGQLLDAEQAVCDTWNTCASIARAWANERAARKPAETSEPETKSSQ